MIFQLKEKAKLDVDKESKKKEFEIFLLKSLAKAQNEILNNYRTGQGFIPSWVYDVITDVKQFYKVDSIDDIK